MQTAGKFIYRMGYPIIRLLYFLTGSFYGNDGINHEKMGLDEIDDAMVELNASVHYNLRMDTDVISAPEDCEKHVTGLLGTVFSVYGQRNSAPVFGSDKME